MRPRLGSMDAAGPASTPSPATARGVPPRLQLRERLRAPPRRGSSGHTCGTRCSTSRPSGRSRRPSPPPGRPGPAKRSSQLYSIAERCRRRSGRGGESGAEEREPIRVKLGAASGSERLGTAGTRGRGVAMPSRRASRGRARPPARSACGARAVPPARASSAIASVRTSCPDHRRRAPRHTSPAGESMPSDPPARRGWPCGAGRGSTLNAGRRCRRPRSLRRRRCPPGGLRGGRAAG
jgi:hypothetical protein